MWSALSLYNSGLGYGGYTPFGNSNSYDGNETWWQKVAKMTPAERAKYQLQIKQVELDSASEIIRKKAEKEIDNTIHARNIEAKKNREITATALSAKNVQTILRSGKIDLFDDAWAKYLNELKNIPEIKANYCDEYGNFKSEADMRSIAVKYYNLLNSPDGGKTYANFDDDASMLPTAFWQGMWNSATFGFYKRSHYGDVMKTAKGMDISREDNLANNAGATLGAAAVGTAIGAGCMTGIDRTTGKFGTAKDIQAAVDYTNLEAAEEILQEKEFKGKTLCEAEKILDKQITDATTELKELTNLSSDSERRAVETAQKAIDDAKKEIEENTKHINEKTKKYNALTDKTTDKAKKLKSEIDNLTTKNNTLQQDIGKKGKLTKALEEANENLKSIENKIKGAPKRIAELNAQIAEKTPKLEKIGRVTEEVRLVMASEASRAEMKAARANINKFKFGREGVDAAAEITDMINNNKATVKEISKKISEQQGSKFAKFSAKYFKGRYGIAIGAAIGAGVGIYNWINK